MNDIDRNAIVGRTPILLTTIDCDRLSALLDATADNEPSVARFLREELGRAEVLRGDVSATSLVTMGSDVTFIDHDMVSIRQARLVYPDEAKNSRDLSVLTAIGSALIGLGPGQSISWHEQGTERRLTVLEVR